MTTNDDEEVQFEFGEFHGENFIRPEAQTQLEEQLSTSEAKLQQNEARPFGLFDKRLDMTWNDSVEVSLLRKEKLVG